MKRFVRSLLLFVLLFVLIYPVALLLWGMSGSRLLYSNLSYRIATDGHLFSRLQEVKTVDSLDVLIVGSSHAFREIDTRLFALRGIRAFNLGSSSQTPLQTQVLMERYLDKVQPRLILYDVYPYFFTTDGVESALNLIACDRNDAYSFAMARRINSLKVYQTLFYAAFRDLFRLNAHHSEAPVIGADSYISGGYVERAMAHFRPEPAPLSQKEYAFREAQFAAFDQILAMFKSRGIDYILIDAPVTRPLYDSYTNRPDFKERMQREGLFIDFNQELQLNDSLHFYDADHLNPDGVKIYVEKLLDIIAAHQLL